MNSRAAILISGGDSVSPFTTPQAECARGLAAGNTNTVLREALLAADVPTFTAPVMNDRGAVREPDPTDFGAFGGAPHLLPAHMTIVSTGDIDNGGEHLARFAMYLHHTFGVREIDWIGHSNGGLFARAATRILQETEAPVTVKSLVTLGTPWLGANPQRIIYGEVPESECRGHASSLAIVEGIRGIMDRQLGLAEQNTLRYLGGPHGWNQAQSGVLDEIPVLLIAGNALSANGGDPKFWPHDGLVSEWSALASDVDAKVLPVRRTMSYPVLHSIFIADQLGEQWDAGMTWNTDVLSTVVSFVLEMRDL